MRGVNQMATARAAGNQMYFAKDAAACARRASRRTPHPSSGGQRQIIVFFRDSGDALFFSFLRRIKARCGYLVDIDVIPPFLLVSTST